MHSQQRFSLDCSTAGNIIGPFDVADFDLATVYVTSVGTTALSTGVVEIVGSIGGSGTHSIPSGSVTFSAAGWKYDIDTSNIAAMWFQVTTAQASTAVTIDCYASNLYLKE